MMTKNEARKKYRGIRKQISAQNKKDASKGVSERVIKLIEENGFTRILLYAALPEEINLDGVFDALSASLEFYFPRVTGDVMEFYRVKKLEDLEEGNFHVREPKEACESIEYKEGKYLMLVPGMAFDEEGYRLGYGKGYYDKYLSMNANKDIVTVGVCFKECFVDEITHDEYDVKVGKVIVG